MPGHGTCFITVVFNPKARTHKIFEVFATVGKAGSCESAELSALTKAITAGLRNDKPIPVQTYIEMLLGIQCEHSIIGHPSSTSDAIARTLQKYKDGIPLPLAVETPPTPDEDEKEDSSLLDIIVVPANLIEQVSRIIRSQICSCRLRQDPTGGPFRIESQYSTRKPQTKWESETQTAEYVDVRCKLMSHLKAQSNSILDHVIQVEIANWIEIHERRIK